MSPSVLPVRAASAPGAEPYALQDSSHQATLGIGWFERHLSTGLGIALRILLIVLVALVLRALIRRAITRLIERMNRTAQVVDGTALGGLLVNAERRRQRSQAIGSVLRSVASFVVLGTAALMALATFQINLAPLLASAGVAGVAIGFGARNLVTDFLSGVFMILEDQYGVGDTIDTGVARGEVIEVGLRVTKLRGDDGAIWYVRNGEVKRVGNHSQGWSTAYVDVTVDPGQDLARVHRTLSEVGSALAADEPWNERLWGPVEVLGLDSVAPDAVVVRVAARTMPGQAASVERELRWRIKQAFDAAGLTLTSRPSGPDGAPAPDAGGASPAADDGPEEPPAQEGTAVPAQQGASGTTAGR